MGQETPPAPELVQVSSGVSSGVVLRCLAPADHRGRVFKLYRKYTLIFSQRFDSERSYADFHLNNITADTAEIYCCSYDYSAFSPYTHISAPPRPITPATPQLSVTPADGRVQPGQMVEFYCQAPPTPTPVEFIFQKRSWEGQDLQIVSRSTSPHFRMGHVVVSDGGMYTCFYLLNKPEGVQNSAPSTRVSLNVRVVLPAPRLSQGGEGVLVCTGSPSYPGAHFSLFQQGSSLPSATQPAHTLQHSVQFAASGHQWEGGGYQCQYSVLLGNTWAHSELSTSIQFPCVPGSPSCGSILSSTDDYTPQTGSMDLPLVCGSISAALLFLMVLLFMFFGIRKYAKKSAKKRRQRAQEQFWKQVHSRDHIIDLTLQRVSTGSTDEGGVSVSEPIYDCPLTSFTIPPAH
ncbi:alpha-1B-glycoprotein-like isoform X2 [Silurus meridionalis]|nr:alpha-1B-glycoprotein-like isoform X2 [Silurus meridionalis]XP_046706293.1 alpha-1B-glycoprotein-like isoform X2 [Silurus meridionalis]